MASGDIDTLHVPEHIFPAALLLVRIRFINQLVEEVSKHIFLEKHCPKNTRLGEPTESGTYYWENYWETLYRMFRGQISY